MVEPTPIPGLFEKIAKVNQRQSAGGGNGHGPTDGGDTARRVAELEASVGKLDVKLDKIIDAQSAERLSNEQRFASIGERLAAIEGKLEAKASGADVGRIVGRVESLPTTWQMITLVIGTVFAILGGSFLILKFGLPHGP